MAEAGVETSSSSARFFCHKCNTETSPRLPDYVCPTCNSGFIERLENHHDSDSDSSNDMDIDFFELVSNAANSSHNRNTGEHSASGSSSGASGSSSSGPRRSQRFSHTLHPRHGRRRVNNDRQYALGPILQDIISQMTTGVFEANVGEVSIFPGRFDLGGFPMLLTSNLASNPGDYAWGRSGLDAIITQLMNQIEGTGPPPLPQEKIDQIPTVKITQEQCDMHLQCSVCMDDFRLEDMVRKLNCDHCYHEDCILPWLKLHATCPVCRKTLTQEFSGASSTSSHMSRTHSNDESDSMESETHPLVSLAESFTNSPERMRSRRRRSSSRINLMEDELD